MNSGGGVAKDEAASASAAAAAIANTVAEVVDATKPEKVPIGNILKKMAFTLWALVEKNELAVKEDHKLDHKSITGVLEELEELVEKLGKHYKVLNKVTHEKEGIIDLQAASIEILREHIEKLDGEKKKSEKEVASLKKVIESLEKKIEEMEQSRKLQRTELLGRVERLETELGGLKKVVDE